MSLDEWVGFNYSRQNPGGIIVQNPGADRGVIIYGNQGHVSGFDGWVGDNTDAATWAALKVKVDSLLVSLALSSTQEGINPEEQGKIAGLKAQASMLATAVGMAVSGVPNDYATQLAQYNSIVGALGAINAAVGARKAKASAPTPAPAPPPIAAAPPPPMPATPSPGVQQMSVPVTEEPTDKRKLAFMGAGILGAIFLSKFLLKR